MARRDPPGKIIYARKRAVGENFSCSEIEGRFKPFPADQNHAYDRRTRLTYLVISKSKNNITANLIQPPGPCKVGGRFLTGDGFPDPQAAVSLAEVQRYLHGFRRWAGLTAARLLCNCVASGLYFLVSSGAQVCSRGFICRRLASRLTGPG